MRPRDELEEEEVDAPRAIESGASAPAGSIRSAAARRNRAVRIVRS